MSASIYALTDPRHSGEIRYIGKAKDPIKRLAGHLRESRRRSTPVYTWIRKLASLGMKPGLLVLETDCADWEASERRHIAEGRANKLRLLNIANGGDGPECPEITRRTNAAALNDPRIATWCATARAMRRAATAARTAKSFDRAELFETVCQWLGTMDKAGRIEFAEKLETVRLARHG